MFKKNEDEMINLLLKENKRLKRENEKYKKMYDDMTRYRYECKETLNIVNDLRKNYEKKIDIFTNVLNEYKSYLNRLNVLNEITNDSK